MKKFASLLLTVVLLAAMLTVFALPASAEDVPNGVKVYYGTYTGKAVDGRDVEIYFAGSQAQLKKPFEKTYDYTYFINTTVQFGYFPNQLIMFFPGAQITAKVYGSDPFECNNLVRQKGTGSILSEGNIWIIAIIAVVVIAGVAALIIVKKKKKPAHASGENKDEE